MGRSLYFHFVCSSCWNNLPVGGLRKSSRPENDRFSIFFSSLNHESREKWKFAKNYSKNMPKSKDHLWYFYLLDWCKPVDAPSNITFLSSSNHDLLLDITNECPNRLKLALNGWKGIKMRYDLTFFSYWRQSTSFSFFDELRLSALFAFRTNPTTASSSHHATLYPNNVRSLYLWDRGSMRDRTETGRGAITRENQTTSFCFLFFRRQT